MLLGQQNEAFASLVEAESPESEAIKVEADSDSVLLLLQRDIPVSDSSGSASEHMLLIIILLYIIIIECSSICYYNLLNGSACLILNRSSAYFIIEGSHALWVAPAQQSLR